jgi:hypothetical protein
MDHSGSILAGPTVITIESKSRSRTAGPAVNHPTFLAGSPPTSRRVERRRYGGVAPRVVRIGASRSSYGVLCGRAEKRQDELEDNRGCSHEQA